MWGRPRTATSRAQRRMQAEVEARGRSGPAAVAGPPCRCARPGSGRRRREVDGEDQDGTAGGGGPGHQVLGVGTVAHDIELEPERGACGRGRPPRCCRWTRSTRRRRRRSARRRGPPAPRHGVANIPARPTGPSTTGMARDWPSTVVDSCSSDTSRRTRWRRWMAARSATLARNVDSLEGAAVDVVEQLAGEPPPRQLAVVADRGRGDTQGAVGEQRHRGRRYPCGVTFAQVVCSGGVDDNVRRGVDVPGRTKGGRDANAAGTAPLPEAPLAPERRRSASAWTSSGAPSNYQAAEHG